MLEYALLVTVSTNSAHILCETILLFSSRNASTGVRAALLPRRDQHRWNYNEYGPNHVEDSSVSTVRPSFNRRLRGERLFVGSYDDNGFNRR